MLSTRERIITAQQLSEEVQVALSNAQKEPLIVTDSGSPAAYLISVDLFDKLVARLESLSNEELKVAIAIGEEQFAQGASKTIAEAEALLEAAWSQTES